MGPTSARRAARERALALLYEAEVKAVSARDLVDQLPVPPDPFAGDLACGVADHAEEIDEVIGAVARGWRLERMPAIDRALLRLATYELLHRPDIPAGATLSEAVELAGQYSTDDSSRFVNGVLARIAADADAAAADADAAAAADAEADST